MRFPRFTFVACFALFALRVAAQSPNANINGLVLDPSNQLIVGAEVIAVNDVTAVQYTTKTNNEGVYVLPNLPPGPYRVQVSKVGFKTIIRPDIILNVQDALSINFTLPIGALIETVTVQGGAPMVNTESAAVSTLIDHAYIENMPLNGRSFQDLILLTPGVVTQTPQISSFGSGAGLGQTGEFSVDGQRPESNYYTVDGVSANVGAAAGVGVMFNGAGPSGSLPAATASGTTQALVSVEALQEFRVQSSTYSAEYGRTPGGQFSFETKSGTNQLHGAIYDYLRNGLFDAQDWFNDYFGTPQPALRQNDFGGTLGGAIEIPRWYRGKDRTFFFVSYEGLRLTAPQAASINLVPDSELRSSAPQPLDQVMKAFPLPNGPELQIPCSSTANPVCPPTGLMQDGLAEYIASWSNPSSIDSASVRLDHVVNGGMRLFFRFSETSSNSSNRGTSQSTPSSDETVAYQIRTYTAGASNLFSRNLSNDFRFNYTSNLATDSTVIGSFGGSTAVDLAQLAKLAPESYVTVRLLFDGNNFGLNQRPRRLGSQSQWNFLDTVSLSRGRHQIKAGIDYRRLTPFGAEPNPEVAYYYQNEPEIQSNQPTFTAVAAFAPGHPLYSNFSAFLQDEWKATRRLSLSLGLRWEVNPPPGVTQGLQAYTLDGTGPANWTLAPQGTELWHTTWHNLAPRLGLAFILHDTPGWETVVRGGSGVFFDTGQQLGSQGFQGQGFTSCTCTSSTPPPTSFPGSVVVPPILNPPTSANGAIGFADHLQLPYTVEWNAALQQQLGKSQMLSASYVGSHASRLLETNSYLPTNNPNSNYLVFITNGLTSDYDSLQLQFQRRLSQGLTALASSTWSHCLDYGSQNYLTGYERGDCDFDVRQSLSIAISYTLPPWGNSPFLRTLLQNWGFDNRFTARTAFPVTLSGSGLVQPNGQFYFEGLNLIPEQPVYLESTHCTSVLQALGDLQPGQQCPGGRAINPTAFTDVASGLGNAPRNFARGFGAWQTDAAIRRDFTLHDRMRLQFRAEAFNIFNHPNFGSINSNFGQPTFGQFTATLANSLGVVSPLYQLGGPRSMQFALKLSF